MQAKTLKRARPRANKKVPPKNGAAPAKFSSAPDLLAHLNDTALPPTSLLDSKINSAERKGFPITRGFLDYFPDAIAAAAEVSFLGNQKHNPGQELHHARGKSADHADCIARHLMQRGGFETITIDGVQYKVRHSVALFWRAGALAQEELEADMGYRTPRGAKVPV